MTDAQVDAASDIQALTMLSKWLKRDWFDPEGRAYLIENFDRFENDFDRIAQIVEKIREERDGAVVIDLRRVG